ncbi:MAG: hypothetical protein A2Z08_07160 [Deltaproteobacteria bacterium RBG_16_54_11]|jgi:hypothetical protein|nr:MAG: hypothetical protein A2Z08_07160 [Deltaproteobacteria bacterium RBG_16_54_11]
MRVYKRKLEGNEGDMKKPSKWKEFVKYIKKLKPDTKILGIIAIFTVIIAIASLIVALMSMLIASNQAEESRKQTAAMFDEIKEMKLQTHNFLKAAKPHITFTAQTQWVDQDVGVYIRNSGSGTAIIKQLTLQVKDKTYDALNAKSFIEALNAMGLYVSDDGTPTYNCFGSEYHFHQGIYENFIVIRKMKRDEAIFKKFSNAISPLVIKIKYESLFSEKFEENFIAAQFFD